MDLSAISNNSFFAVPLVVAIVEAFKMSGFNAKFAPMISIVVGLGISFAINMDMAMGQIIIAGVIYALTASGLYSSVKTTSNIRGKVPLRTDQEAVVVERFEVEKPLGQTQVKADSNLQVNQSITANTKADSSQQQNKQQNSQSQSSQSQSQGTQAQSQAEKPILEPQIQELNIEELNVDNK
jgi:hypothetical protein